MLPLPTMKKRGGGMKKQGRGRETVGDCQKHKNSGKNIQFRVWCRPCVEAKQAGQQGLPKLLQHLHHFSGFADKGFLYPGCLSPQHLRSRWFQTPKCQGSCSLLTSRLYGKLEAPWLSLLASELLMFSGLMSLQVN